MLELGILADDLTGGMMVASLLEREGVRCPLVTSPEALGALPDNAEAVVIGRKIRLIPAEEARGDVTRSAKALRAIDTKRVYYKYCATFDSTAEGNIGPITEALMEALDTDRTIVCPAFPEYSVTIFQGRLFLGSTPLGESFKQYDPATPMTNSNLVEVMQAQSHGKVGLVPRGTLVKGKAAASEAIEKQVQAGTGMFVIDAIDDEDATRIAELVTDWPLSTGADAMPMFLARTFHQEQSPEQRTLLPPSPGGEAVIAGSCAPNTLAQTAYFEKQHSVYRIDLIEARGDTAVMSKIEQWAKENLDKGPVAVATSADVAGVERAQAELGRDGAAALADELLGKSAKLLHDLGVRKFVVAGGETSGQVFKSLDIKQVQVSAFDNLSGGYCHEAGATPTSLVTKAGALGDETFFFTALERMRQADAA